MSRLSPRACSGLMYGSVPLIIPISVITRRRGDVRVRDARETEVEDLHLACLRDDEVRGLQVAVDDAALVRVVHGAADRVEELQPLAQLLARRPLAAELVPHEGARASAP